MEQDTSMSADGRQAEEIRCPVQKAIAYIDGFLEGPMCGKCLPCPLGLYETKEQLLALASGRGGRQSIVQVKFLVEEVAGAARCRKGRDAAASVLEFTESPAFINHAEGVCQTDECLSLVEYKVMAERCTVCGECLNACRYGAILGEKKKAYLSGYPAFEIRQKRCVKCGLCLPACPEGAIVKRIKKSGHSVRAKEGCAR